VALGAAGGVVGSAVVGSAVGGSAVGAADGLDAAVTADDALALTEVAPGALDEVVPVAVVPVEQAAAVARTAVPDTANRVRRGSGRADSGDTVISSRSAVESADVVIFTRLLVSGLSKVQGPLS